MSLQDEDDDDDDHDHDDQWWSWLWWWWLWSWLKSVRPISKHTHSWPQKSLLFWARFLATQCSPRWRRTFRFLPRKSRCWLTAWRWRGKGPVWCGKLTGDHWHEMGKTWKTLYYSILSNAYWRVSAWQLLSRRFRKDFLQTNLLTVLFLHMIL